MLYKIEKNSDNEGQFRGDFIGKLIAPPKLGRSLLIVGEPLSEDGDYRFVSTSEVKQILYKKDGVREIKTRNSVYTLSPIKEKRA